MTELFEIYTKEVEIDNRIYKLKPLSGRYLPKLYKLIRKFEGKKEEEISQVMDEETIADIYTLAFETFKRSYPDMDEDKLDSFVSQNLMVIFEPLVQVNMKNVEE
jgi:hypothetical protein